MFGTLYVLIVDGPVFVGPVLYFVAAFHRPSWLVGLGQTIALDPGLGTWPMLASHSLPLDPWLVVAPGCCPLPLGLLEVSLLVPHGCWSPGGSFCEEPLVAPAALGSPVVPMW